jgi:hypothetical protein
MKYAVEIGSGAMIYILNYIKILLRHSKVNREGGYTETDRRDGECISLL